MLKIKTYTGDGQLAFEEERPKRWRPRNGFQRLSNGEFIKKLGDPRCIHDLEMKALIEQEEKNRQEKLRKEQEEKEKGIVIRGRRLAITQIIHLNVLGSLWEWGQAIDWLVSSGYGNNGCQTYKTCKFKQAIGIKEVDKRTERMHKIELNVRENTIKIWLDENSQFKEMPDFVIKGSLKPEK